MAFEIVSPREIEEKSMETITKELNGRTWPEPEFSVVKRCIHTSADFDYADNLCFSENACQIAIEALKNGADIVTDTKMAMSGINKNKLATFGGQVHCYISDPDVIEEAKARGCTRSTVSMERGAKIDKPVIFVVGNAPTASVYLCGSHFLSPMISASFASSTRISSALPTVMRTYSFSLSLSK